MGSQDFQFTNEKNENIFINGLQRKSTQNFGGIYKPKSLPNTEVSLVSLQFQEERFEFFIIMPNKIEDFKKLSEQKENFRILEELFDLMDKEAATSKELLMLVQLPKFKLESELNVKKHLQAVRNLIYK